MRIPLIFFCIIFLSASGYFILERVAQPIVTEENAGRDHSFTAQEAGFDVEPMQPVNQSAIYRLGQGGWYTLEELQTWERSPGPLRVGIQVGHLDNDDVPDELSGLTRNGAGATAVGMNERDTVAVIAELVAAELRAADILVDILPATVPPKYEADAFVSIHADGNPNTSVRGFKIAGPRRDYSGVSDVLVEALTVAYGAETALPQDPQVTRRMTAYYAFNWPRYEHAIHPFTPAAIVETGFLTNPDDRALLTEEPDRVARAISNGVLAYLAQEWSPSPPPLSLTAPILPVVGVVECAVVREERRNRDERPCEAALTTADGVQYLLQSEPPVATSSLPYQARVFGEYMPVQMLDNYFWFHWEVLGLIDVSSIERL